MTKDDLGSQCGRDAEAAAWRSAYARDYHDNIAVGQMHEHKDTCFKYVIDKSVRFAKHCRFHFCHFVTLWLRGGEDDASKSLRLVTLARTGKDLVRVNFERHHTVCRRACFSLPAPPSPRIPFPPTFSLLFPLCPSLCVFCPSIVCESNAAGPRTIRRCICLYL